MMKLLIAIIAGLTGLAALNLEAVSHEMTMPPNGMHRMRGPRPGPKRNFHKEFFARLTPEERAELDRLAKANDRKGFQAKMRELFKKYPPREEMKIRQLSDRYLAEKNPAEKEKIRKEMEKEIRAQFEQNMEFTKNNISHTEAQLKKAQENLERFKARYEKNRTNAEKIIEFRLQQMCLPEKDRQKMPPPPEHHKPMPPPEHP